MNVRKILFIAFTLIAIALFIIGVVFIVADSTKSLNQCLCIGMLAGCGLFAGVASFVRPGKEGKK